MTRHGRIRIGTVTAPGSGTVAAHVPEFGVASPLRDQFRDDDFQIGVDPAIAAFPGASGVDSVIDGGAKQRLEGRIELGSGGDVPVGGVGGIGRHGGVPNKGQESRRQPRTGRWYGVRRSQGSCPCHIFDPDGERSTLLHGTPGTGPVGRRSLASGDRAGMAVIVGGALPSRPYELGSISRFEDLVGPRVRLSFVDEGARCVNREPRVSPGP